MGFLRRLWPSSSEPPPDPVTLADFLLDESRDLGSRHDVAMHLGEFDLPEVEAALVTVASSATEEEILVDSAGESLWQIYRRQNREVPPEILNKLRPAARKFFQPSAV